MIASLGLLMVLAAPPAAACAEQAAQLFEGARGDARQYLVAAHAADRCWEATGDPSALNNAIWSWYNAKSYANALRAARRYLAEGFSPAAEVAQTAADLERMRTIRLSFPAGTDSDAVEVELAHAGGQTRMALADLMLSTSEGAFEGLVPVGSCRIVVTRAGTTVLSADCTGESTFPIPAPVTAVTPPPPPPPEFEVTVVVSSTDRRRRPMIEFSEVDGPGSLRQPLIRRITPIRVKSGLWNIRAGSLAGAAVEPAELLGHDIRGDQVLRLDLRTTREIQQQRFRRSFLGVSAGLVGGGFIAWAYGRWAFNEAKARNEAAFENTSLSAHVGFTPNNWEYGNCSGFVSSYCAEAGAIEESYPAAAFHGDVRVGTWAEAAGVGVMAASLGVLPPVLRSVATREDEPLRQIKLAAIAPSVGAVLTAASGLWLWRVRTSFAASFPPASSSPDAIQWRGGSEAFATGRNRAAAVSALLGFSAGLLLSGVVDLGLVLYRRNRSSTLRVHTGHLYLGISGTF